MLITNLTPDDYWFGPLHLPAGNGQTLTVDDSSATSLYLLSDVVAEAIETLQGAGKITVTNVTAGIEFPRATGLPEMLHGDGEPEGLIFAPQGTLYVRRDSGQLYIKNTGVYFNTGWARLNTSAPQFTTSSTPPTNPIDGDHWVFPADDTNGVFWEFVYDSSEPTYKWRFVGGPPMYALVTNQEATTSSSYTDLATIGPRVTVARAGDYNAHYGFIGFNNNNSTTYAGLMNGAGSTPLTDVAPLQFLNSNQPTSYATIGQMAGLAASTEVRLRYKVGAGGSTGTYSNRWLSVTPIRV